MQLVVEIPDDITARSLNDIIELSLEVNRKGIITEVYNQEYGFRELTYATMNNLGDVDIIKLKRLMEEKDKENENKEVSFKDIPIYDFSGVKRID